MTEEQSQPETTENHALREHYAQKLRQQSPEAIQGAIAKALKELTGKEYEISVTRIHYAPKWGSEYSDNAELLLRISMPSWRPSGTEDDKQA